MSILNEMDKHIVEKKVDPKWGVLPSDASNVVTYEDENGEKTILEFKISRLDESVAFSNADPTQDTITITKVNLEEEARADYWINNQIDRGYEVIIEAI